MTESMQEDAYEAFKVWWKETNPHQLQATKRTARKAALAGWMSAWAVLSLRTPSDGVRRVKPLIWRDNSGSRNATSKCADTPFGLYDYSKYGADWAVYGQGTLIAEPKDEAGCIAAAQADYEQRILSALSPERNRP